jgi:hypothetical protein
MEIKIKVDPALDDLLLIAQMIRDLRAMINGDMNPTLASKVLDQITYRLRRMKRVTS